MIKSQAVSAAGAVFLSTVLAATCSSINECSVVTVLETG